MISGHSVLVSFFEIKKKGKVRILKKGANHFPVSWRISIFLIKGNEANLDWAAIISK